MADITFITGNQNKADYLAKLLGHPIQHQKLDLEEIQHPNLRTVVDHKVRQAYSLVGKPVLVEDVSLEFCALGRLPGTYIKWFEEELGHEKLCRMLDGFDDRSAIARGMFGYFDGTRIEFIEGSLKGTIATEPRGTNGFGWDPIFIPEGYATTRAEMGPEDDRATYLLIKPFEKLKAFLTTLE